MNSSLNQCRFHSLFPIDNSECTIFREKQCTILMNRKIKNEKKNSIYFYANIVSADVAQFSKSNWSPSFAKIYVFLWATLFTNASFLNREISSEILGSVPCSDNIFLPSRSNSFFLFFFFISNHTHDKLSDFVIFRLI